MTSFRGVFLLEEDKMKQLDSKYDFSKVEAGKYDTWVSEERFKADIPNICHVAYDFLKGKSLDNKNMRVAFNPNNLNGADIILPIPLPICFMPIS